MCTVTFIARRNGFCLGMNRDEKLERAAGLPPIRKKIHGRTVLCPSEPGGGTWIALNDSGACFALINWYSVAGNPGRNPVSRGEVVRRISPTDSPDLAVALLKELSLKRIQPFRLIGIFPVTAEVVEWRWNTELLTRKNHRWMTQQWISSGFDEPTAQRVRGGTFRKALQRASAPGLNWLRALHCSHAPSAGPFSTCMHRLDAATVSYTEITVSDRVATMVYHAGRPCDHPARHRKSCQVRGGGNEKRMPKSEIRSQPQRSLQDFAFQDRYCSRRRKL